jgi:hypothetical protein
MEQWQCSKESEVDGRYGNVLDQGNEHRVPRIKSWPAHASWPGSCGLAGGPVYPAAQQSEPMNDVRHS